MISIPATDAILKNDQFGELMKKHYYLSFLRHSVFIFILVIMMSGCRRGRLLTHTDVYLERKVKIHDFICEDKAIGIAVKNIVIGELIKTGIIKIVPSVEDTTLEIEGTMTFSHSSSLSGSGSISEGPFGIRGNSDQKAFSGRHVTGITLLVKINGEIINTTFVTQPAYSARHRPSSTPTAPETLAQSVALRLINDLFPLARKRVNPDEKLEKR